MNERIELLRETLAISADKFGARIGITRSAISKIENKISKPSEQTILLICREFGVNEDWLRYGKGEMFERRSLDEEMAFIIGRTIPKAPEYVKKIYIELGKLCEDFTENDWATVQKFFLAMAGAN